MDRIHRAIQRFQQGQEFDSLIQEIPRVIGQQFDFDRVLLFLKEGERLEPVALWPGEELLTHARPLSEILLAEGPRTEAVRQGTFARHPSGYGIVPIRSHAEPLGVFVVDRETGVTPEELELLLLMADFAGLAILNARQLKEISLLHRVSNLLSESLELDRVLFTLLTEFSLVLPIDQGMVLLYDKERGGLVHSASLRESPRLGTVCQCPAAAATYEEQKARWVNNPCPERMNSGICAPVPGGVVCLGAMLSDALTPPMLDLVISICNQAANAISNAQQFKVQKDLDQLKNEFLTTVSHELRTPLTSIKGFAAALLKPDMALPPETQEKMVRIIDEQAGRLTKLIEELLDVTRIESGHVSLQLEEARIDKLIERAVASLGVLQDFELEQRLAPVSLPVDSNKLTQVLFNLLENASKYAPKGSRIRIETSHDREGILIRITDQGQGVPPHLRSLLFQKFSRLDNSLTRKTGGTGLGLYIAARLVTSHGGRIWCEDADWGQGACFAVFLPKGAPLKPNPKRD